MGFLLLLLVSALVSLELVVDWPSPWLLGDGDERFLCVVLLPPVSLLLVLLALVSRSMTWRRLAVAGWGFVVGVLGFVEYLVVMSTF